MPNRAISLFFILVCVLSWPFPVAAESQQPSASDRATADRLDAALRAGTKPGEMRAVAADVLNRVRESSKPEVLISGCTSKAVPDENCAARLKALVNDTRLPMEYRLRAAGGLLLRGEDRDVPSLFDGLAKTATEQDLVRAIDLIQDLPSANAVPALVRLLDGASDTAKVAAARALGGFPTPDAIAALDRASGAAPGSPLWAAVTGARARLGSPDAIRIAGAAHPYLEPADLLAAGEGMLNTGDQRAEAILLLTLRNSSGSEQLRAATLLRDRIDERFRGILAAELQNREAAVRRLALRISRTTDQPMTADKARLLLDPDASVRVAAAEFVIAWADAHALP